MQCEAEGSNQGDASLSHRANSAKQATGSYNVHSEKFVPEPCPPNTQSPYKRQIVLK